MAVCKAEMADGIVCGNTIYECRQCGHIGCFGHNKKCPYQIRDEYGKCKKCGSIVAPKKHMKPKNTSLSL